MTRRKHTPDNIIDTKHSNWLGHDASRKSSEGMAISRDGKKLYCNLTGSERRLEVVDLDTKKLIANWPIRKLETPIRWSR